MKKSTLSLIICILASIFFSSCRSNMSVAKRHYSNSYYIAHHRAPQAGISSANEKKKPALYTPVKHGLVSSQFAQNPIADHNDLVASNAQQIPKGKTTGLKRKTIPLKFSPAKTHRIHLQLKKKPALVASGDGGGLSLFWVVILVILILWALGFIGGFTMGGLINLLLLVALILLILWLLRII
ncbi:MAG: lmo0937 family membrane protein [Bacteroidia bacterium]